LSNYLNEFGFRFNRRRSRSRGMLFYRVLELAVAHDPVRYQYLIVSRRPRTVTARTPLQTRASDQLGLATSKSSVANIIEIHSG
jgi:hypothetical protein